MSGSFANSIFNEEPLGTFANGHIFISEPDLTGAKEDHSNGYWHCDIADHNRLTWSEKVYELFDIPVGAPIDREAALNRYAEHSKTALAQVRKYSLARGYGFILDAEIQSEGAGSRWIRVLAVPILAEGRLVGLHGVKRGL